MADDVQQKPSDGQNQGVETPPSTETLDMEPLHDAAEKFLAAQEAERAGTPPVERQRDANGRFVGQGAASTGSESVPASTPQGIDPVWVDVAKREGLSDEQIASFKSESDIESAIQARRVIQAQRVFQSMGVDLSEFAAFLQQKRGGQQPMMGQQAPPQSQPQTVAQAIEELKLDLDEDEVSPVAAKALREVAERINKLGAVAAENQKLIQKVNELEGYVRQSAESARAAQLEAQYAQELDQAAQKIPGFLDYFGKPSELRRLAQVSPNHPKVLDAAEFDGRYQVIWQNYVGRLGDNEVSRFLALRDTWNQSPLSRVSAGPGNGTNGTGANARPANGSVVRQTASRSTPTGPMPSGADLDSELKRIESLIGGAWDNLGHNPLASTNARP